jgi:hypothetical protein
MKRERSFMKRIVAYRLLLIHQIHPWDGRRGATGSLLGLLFLLFFLILILFLLRPLVLLSSV